MKVITNRFADVLDEQRAAAVASTSVRAADVRPEKVEWLWPGRVPFAMTTVLGGFPGVGKSTVLYDLAARVSLEVRPS